MKPQKPSFARPFDKLATTKDYARRLALDTGIGRLVVHAHPDSAAAAMGLRFGVFEIGDPLRAGTVVCAAYDAAGNEVLA